MYQLTPTTLPAAAANVFALILDSLTNPRLWVQDCLATDHKGRDVNPSSPYAVAWNLSSHFNRAIERFCNPEANTSAIRTQQLLQATLQGLFQAATCDDVKDWADDPDVTPKDLHDALSSAVTLACGMASRHQAARRDAYDILNTAASFLANHRALYLGDLENSPQHSFNATLEDAVSAFDVRNYQPLHHLAQAETQARWQLAQTP